MIHKVITPHISNAEAMIKLDYHLCGATISLFQQYVGSWEPGGNVVYRVFLR
jgi:hypothetical protein